MSTQPGHVMNYHRLSPSKLKLAEACTYWCKPGVEYPAQPSGRAARIGTLVHRMAEMLANGQSVAVSFDGDLREIAEALSIVQGPLKEWIATWRSLDVPRAAELSLRMDVETGAVRTYPRRGAPGYELPKLTEIGGEIDLLRNFGTHVECIDLKSGDPRHFAPAQLRAYALMVSKFYGVSTVRVAFLRALKTKVSLTDWVELDVDALDEEHGRLRRMLRMLPDAQPQPGDHCHLCDCKRAGACPAWQEPTTEEREQAFAF